MKNILYIGPYRDSNGLGYSSRRYIEALINNQNINLCLRPVFFTNSSIKNNLDFKIYDSFQHNKQSYYDYVIQHGYPEMFVYNKTFGKNIGIVEIETRNINRSGWLNRLNLMDEIYINSINGINCLHNIGGLRSSIKLMPEPYDLDLYNKDYDPFFTDLSDGNKPFIFYTIGQYTDKKNIKGIILAYLLEFTSKDNVKLFIKTDSYYSELTELDTRINFDINSIKNAIRKNNYPDINVVCGSISDVDIIRLHKSSDCYINTVRADGFGPCAIESMLCKKLIINTKNVGSSTYFNSSNALMVDSIPVNVFATESINKNIFTMSEEWDEPNIFTIRKQMRAAYNMNKDSRQELINNYNYNIFSQSYFNNNLL